jgi:superfamily II DNA/RNA helicase
MKKTHSPTKFSSFSFSLTISDAIASAGFKKPTKVQQKTIPVIMSGKDVLARAHTGSGKTAAFVLPLLDNMSNQGLYERENIARQFNPAERAKHNAVQILVLVPTRELTIQIAEVFNQFSKNIHPKISCLSVYGGVKINPQMMALRGGTDVLIATPGRLLDLIDNNAIHFNQLKALVIDEVDRLMKGDFEEEITRITKLLPNRRQNLMFTATFPDSIRSIVRKVLTDPVVVNIDDSIDNNDLDQHVVTVNHNRKNDLLAYLLNENDWQQILIFCSAKRTCDNLVIKLKKRGIEAVAMHGNKEQSARMQALKDFKAGKTRILIATDVAARGIDIEHLPCIINFDLPRSPNDYIHRIGRTARAGSPGQAITLIAHHEYQHFKVIENRNDIRLEREQVEGFEADDIAPPPPVSQRKKPKTNNKKSRKRKLSAKQMPKREKAASEKADSITAQKEVHNNERPVVNPQVWGKHLNKEQD